MNDFKTLKLYNFENWKIFQIFKINSLTDNTPLISEITLIKEILKSGYLINNWVSHDNGSELLSGYNNIYHNTKANTKLMLKFFWQIILKLSTKTQLKTNFITCSFWPFFFKFSLANSDGEGGFSTMIIITTHTNTLHDKNYARGYSMLW